MNDVRSWRKHNGRGDVESRRYLDDEIAAYVDPSTQALVHSAMEDVGQADFVVKVVRDAIKEDPRIAGCETSMPASSWSCNPASLTIVNRSAAPEDVDFTEAVANQDINPEEIEKEEE